MFRSSLGGTSSDGGDDARSSDVDSLVAACATPAASVIDVAAREELSAVGVLFQLGREELDERVVGAVSRRLAGRPWHQARSEDRRRGQHCDVVDPGDDRSSPLGPPQ